jgi:hypothetical protein
MIVQVFTIYGVIMSVIGQLWIIYSYAKCAQISELEAIITVRRPHRQRLSSAANALLCNIGEGKQCNLLSYF